MAPGAKIPPPPVLAEDATFSTYSNWKNSLLMYLKSVDAFKRFITGTDTKWAKKTSADQCRGLQDETATVTSTEGGNTTTVTYSAQLKVNDLNDMLDVIARYVPCFLANDITKNTTSLEDGWQVIRKYFGFRRSEANFLKFYTISWEENERPERLYCRLLSHLHDNLILKDGTLKHDGVIPTADEELSPTAERLAVLRWLDLLHPRLPAIVARTFSYDLQHMSLKDLQPQIVDALETMLLEARSDEPISKIGYIKSYRQKKPPSRGYGYRPRDQRPLPMSKQPPTQPDNGSRGKPSCRVCVAEGRPYRHRISECQFISRGELEEIANFRQVTLESDESSNEEGQPLQETE